VLKEKTPVLAGEVIDAAVMSYKALKDFYAAQIEDAKQKGVLLSLHLKATMMKVSDPIMFGAAVEVYYKDLFEKYGELFKKLGVDVRNGFGDIEAKIAQLPPEQRAAVEADIKAIYESRPELAMVLAALDRCRTSHRGRSIIVRGEPGIGKTRLVEAVTNAARERGVEVHSAQVFDFGQSPGRGPITALALSIMGADTGASDAQRAAAVRRVLASRGGVACVAWCP